jgi:uncharacterized YccA/Bax inhibitor family protein
VEDRKNEETAGGKGKIRQKSKSSAHSPKPEEGDAGSKRRVEDLVAVERLRLDTERIPKIPAIEQMIEGADVNTSWRTGNPALNEKAFSRPAAAGETMSLSGAVNRTFLLLVLLVFSASWIWRIFYTQGPQAISGWIWAGIWGGLGVAVLTVFKPAWSPALAPAYAVVEGLAIGGISAFFEAEYPGIVIQAVVLTFGTLFVLLLAYRSGLIRATENFKLGIVSATGAIALVYLFAIFGRVFFGWRMPFIHESSPVGIAFSVFVVVIAALNLVLDFDFIEKGDGRAPKYMEWYAAFGLLVTLVWLYLEILRLLAKTRRR